LKVTGTPSPKDTDAELLGIFAEAGCHVSAAAAAILEAATRKRKWDCADACSKAMAQLGLRSAGRCEGNQHPRRVYSCKDELKAHLIGPSRRRSGST